MSKLDIIERLKNLNLKNDSAIHVDLYDTEETKLMEEFLHFILIKKTYGENKNIINISKDIEIKIEIPNGYKDYFIVYPILTLFPTKKLSIKNLSPLIVTNEIDSNIQIVANYLKALKNDEIDKIDLYFEKVSPLDFLNLKTTKIVKSLPQNECEELIFNEIQEYIFEPNYYEIESFINYLANQFKKLCSNFYLCTDNLMYLIDKSSKIKTFIVKTIIKEAIFIIEGSHAKFLKEQIMINEMINKRKDFNLGIENLIQNKEKEISFDKLNYPLFFFNQGSENQSYSIISNLKKSDKEYPIFHKLINIYAISQRE